MPAMGVSPEKFQAHLANTQGDKSATNPGSETLSYAPSKDQPFSDLTDRWEENTRHLSSDVGELLYADSDSSACYSALTELYSRDQELIQNQRLEAKLSLIEKCQDP